MSKRRVEEPEDSDIDVSSTDSENEQEEQIEQEDETVNVDFDFFDLNPEVDFHATKNFLRQLFGDDSIKFDLSAIADLFLKENSVGTTIKTEGKEGDPFALLSVINLSENKGNSSIKAIVDYVLEKTTKNMEFNYMLKKLIKENGKITKDTSKQLKTGLIVSERLINMPVEVVPPMYKMLLEEMEKSEDAHEKYEFDYFLIVSKVYEMVASNIQDDEDNKKSKKKKPATEAQVEMDYFHYEDLVLEANAMYHGYYEYTNKHQETDSRRVFTEYGIEPKLSVILIDKDSLAKSVPEMEQKFPPF
ncbi:Mss4p nuclear export [Yamadazyma tenuis]|uniref:Protein BCP1 n=1 Tax=Candida tenuis (strain ATCC 10573 / BCRC 21748 / CBS 615 / JCM 9827 / NBRC 10315 / NRRL Y-1498 / VKM Y-70) TaxID=590646 RepID=G3B9X4_CANTC|nr:uncharacterized protein CANTEDRAFT_114813 [Yamadazyma tenuis ATCC 10573]XP_006688658.1 uncharacterized protein CANTEDRAFT_114813 [Yamadazyma tenuis ATCC 10573]EGV62487.1 hypothetical protein CANTEDRAFT_114813 [Yamadazyma tenuis ATCC 10573]EGV62488.1 hypothetical protein CANTEDRAFT_114813 [Yamadazyma tenuis ATCC 10573]WEJ92561.1 Mss4p nuclear export [Yamadazyma tenuis]